MKLEETAQHQRFRDKARELGADESDDALDRSFERLDLRSEKKPEQREAQESDA